ncbi:hypothetical protein CLAFUW4_03313 [Fulvia fulva]|uniref:Uncharacterized protein n=1 Tax=Passalora fulva TaxID=5499 RepID=A0A9Q8P4Z9_PASFU|nr:uncharacterized protein CLAFUR5_03292 [Fulvia fulva]KAK4631012.1 hypothetical protein CLAFUR4_03302 [Fulvia fulva]KAK4633988.1 hypothetical protein CLAFUR0_03306 [Fulvia fulva]UJO13366.1 hypothetical protein CLAFUR5_03292 [Fulvia fulva]WPV10594.1 hypothetical protein CLAFUW4_03313 [Fulvia fulva]WPV26956.1 hypothetical protein CLAFUW7_03305 [Fulvia fulva]
MAAPRLPFLWPMLAKSIEASNPAVRSAKAAARIRALHSSSPRRRPEAVPQQPRYGTANEPPAHLGGGKKLPPSTSQETTEQTKLPKIGERLQRVGEAEVKVQSETLESQSNATDKTQPTTVDPMLDSADARPSTDRPASVDVPPIKPLDSLLDQVPDPSKHAEESGTKAAPEEQNPDVSFDEHTPSAKAPHIDTPRHVHHFDTYGLVRSLVDAGWSEAQAITIMKGVRIELADNMDMARDALVSKSQVENETYLFRAACAELKTEVTTNRRAEQEKMRTERTQLQHEVDILSQRIGQESAVLKDELKGMFDDRKMSVRNEQRSMESSVQRLNYKITVDLKADGGSAVESVRWALTRRAGAALFVVVVTIILALRLQSNAAYQQEQDAKRKSRQKTSSTQTDAGSGSGGRDSGGGDSSPARPELVAGEVYIKDGDNPALVTLG